MRTIALGAALLAVAAPGIPRADETRTPFTLAEVLARADDVPQARQAIQQARAARNGVAATYQVPNPEIGLRIGRGMPRDGGPDGLEWGLDVTVPLDWLATRGPQIRAAQARADAGGSEAAGTRLEVRLRLAALFHQIARDQQMDQVLTQTEAHVAALTEAIHRRVATGEARPIESTRIETDLARIRLERDRAAVEARVGRDTLAAFLGWTQDTPLVVANDPSLPPAPDTRDTTVARILASHPGLAAARAHGRALEARVQVEQARRVPGIAVGAYFDREQDRDVAGALLLVRIPVWNWNTGGIRKARTELAARVAAVDNVVLEARVAAIAAWERCVLGLDATRRFTREILPRAEQAEQTIERAYDLGEASLIDALDARRVLLDVRREEVENLYQARLDCTTLQLMTGEDHED